MQKTFDDNQNQTRFFFLFNFYTSHFLRGGGERLAKKEKPKQKLHVEGTLFLFIVQRKDIAKYCY